MYIGIVCYPVCEVINFEIYLKFFKLFTCMTEIQNKILNISKTKRVFQVKSKAFLQDFQLPEIVSDVRGFRPSTLFKKDSGTVLL